MLKSLLACALLLAAPLAAQPIHHQVPAAVLDVAELTARLRRLDDAKLLATPEPRHRDRPILALAKERPRPGQLLRTPKPLAALSPAKAALLPPRSAISADTPRSFSGFAALDDNLTAIPPDTHGAVGPNHVMTVLNSEVAIHDRQGRRLTRLVLEDFWRAHSSVDIGYDPRLRYDAGRDRWLFCVLAEPDSTANALYVGVSQTPDPTGRWNLFRIPRQPGNTWMDYPTMAVSGPWLLITVNNYTLTAGRSARGTLFAFTAQDLYDGQGRFRTFTDSVVGAPVEAGPETSTAALISSLDDDIGGEGILRISELSGVPGAETFTPEAARLRLPQPWRFSAVADNFGPQLGTNFMLDLGDDRMQQCMLRNSVIWCTHTVFLPAGPAPTRAAVQVVEIASEPGAYRLLRQNRIEDPASETMYAYPSLAVNQRNDVLVGYSRFSARQFASANFSFRAGSDPPGQFQADTLFKQGEAPFRRSLRRNRWGDYSAAQVDPLDGLSLWTIQEYAASATPAGTTRWATWWARVTPQAAPCTYSLAAASFTAAAVPASTTLAVRASPPACSWMAASHVPWLTISSGSPAQGDGTVAVAIARNSSTADRRGAITIAGQDVTFVQQAGPAAADLVVTALTAPTSATLGRGLSVSAEVRNAGSLPAGAFRFGFFLGRRPEVTVADTFTGFACNLTTGLAAGQGLTCAGVIQLPATLNPGNYYLAAIADFENTAVLASRETTTRVADTGVITVSVSPDAPAFSLSGVAHGATALPAEFSSAISPGQVVVIYGRRFGPAELITATPENGRFPTSLAGTSVRFDGVPAPLLYVAPGQLAVMAPFGLAAVTTRIQIIAGGLPSEIITAAVVPTAPGLFTTNFSGTGPAALLNQNSTVNTAANPAVRGSIVQLYSTGLGRLTPAVADGSLSGAPLPALQEEVRVEIGGRPAQVLYAGPAPGLVAGVMQVNARIANDAATGAVPIRLILPGDVTSRSGVTVAVQ